MQNLLILVFVACWNLNSVNAQFDDYSQSSRDCGKGNKQFKRNNIYHYFYEGEIESGIGGVTNETASLGIRAKVTIHFLEGCSYAMKIDNVEFIEKLGNKKQQTDTKIKRQLMDDVEKNSLLFTMDEGLVTDIRPKRQERNKSVLNIKRSILSMLQMKWAKKRDGIETDISGVCSVTYRKAKKDGRKVIVKKKDLYRCKKRTMTHSIVESVQYAKPQPWYDAESSCEYFFRRKHEMDTVECRETLRMRTFSSGSASGGFTKSRQTLKLLKVARNRRTVPYDEFYTASLLYEHDDPGDTTERGMPENAHGQAENILSRLTEESTKYVQPNAARTFADLVVSLRFLKRKELEALAAGAQDCYLIEPCDLNTKLVSQSFLFDALAQCGSTSCVRVVLGIVKKYSTNRKILRQLVSSMVLIQKPTAPMLNEIMDLHQAVNEPALLSLLGTMVHTICLDSITPCEQMDTIRHAENYMLRLLGNDCTVRDAAKANQILNALKAIGNAGRPMRAHALVIDCARNAAHLNVSITALHTLKKMQIDADFKSILYEMVTDKNADIERRMESFFLLMSTAGFDDALLIVEMVNDRRESGQLRSLMHSYIHSILRSKDPSKQRLKEDFQNALKQKKLDMFDVPVSRFSKFKSLSFYFDNIQIGATADAMMFFHPESFIPRTLRLNFTNNVFGNAINFMELNLRTEGLEILASNFLKKGGYLSMDYVEKLFSIPDMAERESMTRQGHRMPRDSGELPAYQRRLEELQNKVNLKEPTPQVALGLNIFGRELPVFTLDDLPLLTQGLDSFNIIEQLFFLSKGASTSIQRNMFFLETQHIIPTMIGFPVKLQVNGSAVARLGVKGTVHLGNILFASKVLSMDGELRPSISVELSGRLTVDGHFSQNGAHVNSSLYTATTVGGKVTYAEGSKFDVDLKIEETPYQVLNISHNVFQVAGNTETPVKGAEKEAKVDICGSDFFNAKKIVGLDICAEVAFPVAFHNMKSPFFPLTGPSHAGLVIVRRDPELTRYNIIIEKIKDVYEVKVSTPGAEIPREYVMEVGVNVLAHQGVIGATFGKSRKGLMLRYEYDNATHSVKAQLNSNLTKPVIIKGHYFNSTHPVSLEKKFGYEIGIESDNFNFYNSLQFEDTYNFWGLQFITRNGGKESTFLFQIQYEPQIISLQYKQPSTNTLLDWQIKPGFPSLSSHVNITFGRNYRIYGSGMVDILRLIGEGELTTMPWGHYMKGKFSWINKKKRKGLKAVTIWGNTSATVSGLFRLNGNQRVFTAKADINGKLYTSQFVFDKSNADLNITINRFPILVKGNVDVNAFTKTGLRIVLPGFDLHFMGASKREPTGQIMCFNTTFNNKSYDSCISSSYDTNSKRGHFLLRHPLRSTTAQYKRKKLSNGVIYTAGIESNKAKLANVEMKWIVNEKGNDTKITIHLPIFGVSAESAAFVDHQKKVTKYSSHLVKTKSYENTSTRYKLVAKQFSNALTGKTRSYFTAEHSLVGKVGTNIWTAHDVSIPGLPLSKSPIKAFGIKSYIVAAPIYVPFKNPKKKFPYKSQSDVKLDAFLERQKNVTYSFALTRTLVPVPVITVRVGPGKDPNKMQLTLMPVEGGNNTLFTIKHPIINKLSEEKLLKLRDLKGKGVRRLEALIRRSGSLVSKFDKFGTADIYLEMKRVAGENSNHPVVRKLANIAERVRRLMTETERKSRIYLRLEYKRLLDDIINVARKNDITLLKGMFEKFERQGKDAETKANSFVKEFLKFVRDIKLEAMVLISEPNGLQDFMVSAINSTLEDVFNVYNMSVSNQEVIRSYTNLLFSLVLTSFGEADVSAAVAAIIGKAFSHLRNIDVNKTVQSQLSYFKDMLGKYGTKGGLPSISSDLVIKALDVLSHALDSLARDRNITAIVEETISSFIATSKHLLAIGASDRYDASSKLFGALKKFLVDLDVLQFTEDLIKLSLETAGYKGDASTAVEALTRSKDLLQSVKGFASFIIAETSATPRIKEICRSFLENPNMQFFAQNVLTSCVDMMNVTNPLKAELLKVIDAKDLPDLAKRLTVFILKLVVILPESYGIDVKNLEVLFSDQLGNALRNLTKVLIRHIEDKYPSNFPSWIHSFLSDKGNTSRVFQAYLKDSPIINFFIGLDQDVKSLLKTKSVYEFSRSTFKRFLKFAQGLSTFNGQRILSIIKRGLLDKAIEISDVLLAYIPDEVNPQAKLIVQEFVDVLDKAEFNKGITNITGLVHEIVHGWTEILESSDNLQMFLDQAQMMVLQLGNVIEIGGVKLPDLYKRFVQDVQNQAHLIAKIFGQFYPKKYSEFIKNYVRDGKIDLYKVYEDFLNANFSETFYNDVDNMVDLLSVRALKEIKGRTQNFNIGTLIRNIIDSIVQMNYSDINTVLKKYEKLDYAKYGNLSFQSLKTNILMGMRNVEELQIDGRTVKEYIRTALMSLSKYIGEGLKALNGYDVASNKAFVYYRAILNTSRMNGTQILNAAFENLREYVQNNKKLENVLETLGLPLFGGLMKLIKETPVGNYTLGDVWIASISSLHQNPTVPKGYINTLMFITQQMGKLQDPSSLSEALTVVIRIIDALYRVQLTGMEHNIQQFNEITRLVNTTMKFVQDYISKNNKLSVVQFISKFVREFLNTLDKEFSKSPIMQAHYKALAPLFAEKATELDKSKSVLVNHTSYIVDMVSSTIGRTLSSKALDSSIPMVLQNASLFTRTSIKRGLRLLDKVRVILRKVDLFRNPKEFFHTSVSDHLRKSMKKWRKMEGPVFKQLYAFERNMRNQMLKMDVRSEYFKEIIDKTLKNSDTIFRNFSLVLKKKLSEVDAYVIQMKGQFRTLSEEYLYRLLLNWDVLLKRVIAEVQKPLIGKNPFKGRSIEEVANRLTELLKTWKHETLSMTRETLKKYFSKMAANMKNTSKERLETNKVLDAIEAQFSRNVTSLIKNLMKATQFSINGVLNKYERTSASIRQYFSRYANFTNLPAFTEVLKSVSQGIQVNNGSVTVVLPWSLKHEWLSKNAYRREKNQYMPFSSIVSGMQAFYLKGAEMNTIFHLFGGFGKKLESVQNKYKKWLLLHSRMFKGIAQKYNALVDRINVNATDYVFQLYRQRFLVPLKHITADASIAAPVDSLPPMPTFPRAWGEVTAIFKPITRTAILYGRHIFTFDGQYVYTALPSRLRSGCTYVLARDFRFGNFTLLYQDSRLIVESIDTKVVFQKGEKIEAYQKVSYSNFIGPFSDVPMELGSTVITKSGPLYKVKSNFGFEVNCHIDYLLCNFTLSGFYHNKTLGLFGTNNEEYADDLRLPGGAIAVDMIEFLNEWELTKADTCNLRSAQDFMYGCRRLPSPRCRQIFKDLKSPLAKGFSNVNPASFLAACEYETSKCDEYSTSRTAHCPIASAYVQLAISLGARIPYLKECAVCRTEKYGSRLPTNKLRVQLKAVDIVVLIKETENMEPFLSTLKRVLAKMDTQLKTSGMNILYSLVGFEGDGYRALPHIQTGNKQDAMSFSDFDAALENLEFDGNSAGTRRFGLDALKFAAGLPLRPLATKIFLMVEDDVTYSGRLREMIEVNDILRRNGIILNAINNYRLKKDVIGKSATGKRYHVKIPKGEQLRSVRFPPADDYLPIVRETKGAILTLKGLFSPEEKSLKAFPVSLSSILYHQIVADLRLCKQCICEPNKQGFGKIVCLKTKKSLC